MIDWIDYNNHKTLKNYTGFVKNQKPHGNGILLFKDGMEVHSNFKNGVADGISKIYKNAKLIKEKEGAR